MNDKLAQRLEQYSRDADSVKSHKIANDLREAASALRSSGEAVAWQFRDGDAWITTIAPDIYREHGIEVRSLHPATPASGWRPIAEAPRDGTRILVTGTEMGTCVASAGWSNDTPGDIRWEVVNDIVVHPTKWQPLPPTICEDSPKGESTKGG